VLASMMRLLNPEEDSHELLPKWTSARAGRIGDPERFRLNVNCCIRRTACGRVAMDEDVHVVCVCVAREL